MAIYSTANIYKYFLGLTISATFNFNLWFKRINKSANMNKIS